jgi:hypothetical protein
MMSGSADYYYVANTLHCKCVYSVRFLQRLAEQGRSAPLAAIANVKIEARENDGDARAATSNGCQTLIPMEQGPLAPLAAVASVKIEAGESNADGDDDLTLCYAL